MTVTRDDLYALREGWDFEAKRAAGRDGRGKVPDSFWETYSAMANARGGRIVLGVKERADGTFEIHGLGDPGRVERELWDLLQNRNKVSANLLDRDDVQLEEIDGRSIIVIAVPRAERRQRPVFINDDMWAGTFFRVHEGDRRADRERVRRMVAEATYETRDDRVLARFGLDDLESETVRAYRTIFANRKPDHTWLPLDDTRFLEQLGAWRRDRETGDHGITSAGLLMFGKHNAIREEFPNYFVDYQERPADADAVEWLDRLYPDGTWSGNLYDFYRRVIQKVTADLRVPFQLDRDLYRRDDTHVHEAVREAMANTLIHADYEGRVSILVIRRPDGLEFRNPGGLRIPIDQIRRGGVSDCRNRTLQQMFLMIGIGELAGSGFSRILRAWVEQHWRVPSLIEDIELDTATLHLSMASLLPQEVLDELDRRFPGAFGRLGRDERLAVATAMAEGRVTNRRMQEISSLHPRDLTFMFRDLVVRGFLVPHGERSGTWYTVTEVDPAESRAVQSSPQSCDSSPQSFESSPQSHDDSPLDSGSSRRARLQKTQENQTGIVEKVAASRWARQEDVREAILELCGDEYVTIQDLSRRLNRKQTTLQQNYVKQLVDEGLLEPRYPEQPNHPGQAYRSAQARR